MFYNPVKYTFIESRKLTKGQKTPTFDVFNPKQIKMIVSNTETIPGKEIVEILGIARGSTVRARNIGRDIFAGLKNIVGGEIEEYTKLQAQSREQAIQRLIMDAINLGADAVVNIRFNTSMIMQGASEILAYGTAVKLK
jgi:uncharacterized protein YbjQ (UPF0145 family)